MATFPFHTVEVWVLVGSNLGQEMPLVSSVFSFFFCDSEVSCFLLFQTGVRKGEFEETLPLLGTSYPWPFWATLSPNLVPGEQVWLPIPTGLLKVNLSCPHIVYADITVFIERHVTCLALELTLRVPVPYKSALL